MKLKICIIAAAMVALSSCVQTMALDTPFNPALHEYAAMPGKATISGQAFMRRNDGMVVYAAGSPVFLLPDTAYTREMYNKAANSYMQVDFTNADKRLVNYSKKGQADGEGRFSFTNMPDGNYLIVTAVNWMAGNYQQGGDLTKYVTVANGQNVDTIITR